jgi:hypothetical protein
MEYGIPSRLRAKTKSLRPRGTTHNGRAKTRLRKAYVAASSLVYPKLTTRARQSQRRQPRRFW